MSGSIEQARAIRDLCRDPREFREMYGNKFPPKERLVRAINEGRRKRLSNEQLAQRLLEEFRDHDRANARERMRELKRRRRAEAAA